MKNINRLWIHIKTPHRVRLYFLILLMSLSTFAEIISIGAIAPFLAVLTSPDYIFNHDLMEPVKTYLNIKNPKDLLFPLTFFFGISILLTAFFKVSLIWMQTQTIHIINADISSSMYKRVIHQNYEKHFLRNSSEIIATIITKSNALLANLLHPVLAIINAILMIGIALFLIIILDPSAFFVFPVVVLIYILIVLLMKKRLSKYSNIINYESSHIIKIIQESLGTIRDIIIDRSQNFYMKIFDDSVFRNQNAQSKIKIISGMPRLIIEPAGMILIISLSYYYVNTKENPFVIIPYLGMFALGAQRTLPVVQSAYASISSIRGGHNQVEEALELLNLSLSESVTNSENIYNSLDFKSYIRLSDIGYKYPSENHFVIKNLDLIINKGERIGIIGSTGSGKSTLLDLMLGLLRPTSGAIFIDNIKVDSKNILNWHLNIAHIPQDIYISDNTIYENIALGIDYSKIDKNLVHHSARQANIYSSIVSMKHGFNTVVGENGSFLSGGQRQRIGIARALYKKVNVLFLDEATSALDDKTEKDVLKEVCSSSQDLTVIMITHRLSSLKDFDKVALIEDGRIVKFDSYSKIVKNKNIKKLEKY